jgi:hypothetical protein
VEEPLRRAGPNPLGRWHARAIGAGAAVGAAALALLHLGPAQAPGPSSVEGYFGASMLVLPPPLPRTESLLGAREPRSAPLFELGLVNALATQERPELVGPERCRCHDDAELL